MTLLARCKRPERRNHARTEREVGVTLLARCKRPERQNHIQTESGVSLNDEIMRELRAGGGSDSVSEV